MGARQFLRNVSGPFKLEVLNPAIVRNFYVEEFGDQTNITLNETRSVTFICDGDGNPPPILTLVSTSTPFTTRYLPHLEHTIKVFSSRNTDKYQCIASNGLGNDSKSIFLDVINFKDAASIRDFYVDGFPKQNIVILFGTQIISFKYVGMGKPPPEMTQQKNENIYAKNKTSLTLNLTLSSNKQSGFYTCLAFNALGEHNMSIQVYAYIEDPHTDGISWINICIYAACLIIIVVLAVILCKSRFSNRFYSRTPKVKKNHIISLEMVTPAHIEPNDVNELTILETPSTGSVHVYETIPPSPIADLSFDTVSGDVGTVVIHTMEPTQPERYESLCQRDVSLYNTIELN